VTRSSGVSPNSARGEVLDLLRGGVLPQLGQHPPLVGVYLGPLGLVIEKDYRLSLRCCETVRHSYSRPFCALWRLLYLQLSGRGDRLRCKQRIAP
jgi:hypothetical protein